MKKLLLFILILSAYCCDAQHYQCLQSGVKHYFTNGNGYLRGIRIDSVRAMGDTTVYYPFHTPRGGWGPDGLGSDTMNFDLPPGSWLGEKVMQLNGNTFLFDNLWGDTVIIQAEANLGSSWLFCRDTSAHYYMATVTSIDTMTFSGVYDTVKTITISAYYDSSILASDSLNGFQIMLSKNHGFVQVFDLYTFPYHPAYTMYTTGLDFYLDVSLMPGPTATYPIPPGVNNSIYKLVTFINPTSNQLNEANIGAVFESTYNYCSFCAFGLSPFPLQYTIDTIISKIVLPHSVKYLYSGLQDNNNLFPPPTYIESYYSDSLITNDSTYLFDTTKMPEETNTNFYSYYFPSDSSYCTISPAYESGFNTTLNLFTSIYKIGFGQTYYYYATPDPSYLQDELIFANKNNDPCGSLYPLPPLSTPSLNAINTFTIFPNPATTTLTIQSTNEPIAQITITNIIGQVVYSGQFAVGSEQVVDVSALPGGVYFVKVNNIEVRKFVKQ